MNPSALRTIVAEWLEEDQFPTLVPRQRPVVDLEGLKNILAIVGPRRAGKTYFMYQLVRGLLQSGRCTRQDILFVDFEDYRLGGFSPDDIDPLFAAFHQLAGRDPAYLFFDEVQHVPRWSRVLRTLHNRRRFRIIVSGSNSSLLQEEVATELRGRYEDVLLLPFSFQEHLQSRGFTPSPAALHTSKRGAIVAAFDAYLEHGGFPEVVLAEGTAERRKLLQGYFRTTFYKDLLDRHGIKARYVLDALMNDFLETYAEVFSISKFEKQLKANELPGSKRTISNYIHHLAEAFFILAHERFAFSPRRRLMNPKKIYLMDTGFAALGRSSSENRGKVLENLVAIELRRRGRETYYFKGDHECDFIIRTGRQPTEAIQVCWELTPRNERRELAGLSEARRALDVKTSLIITYEQEGGRDMDGHEVPVSPAWKWLISSDRGG